MPGMAFTATRDENLLTCWSSHHLLVMTRGNHLGSLLLQGHHLLLLLLLMLLKLLLLLLLDDLHLLWGLRRVMLHHLSWLLKAAV